MINPLIHNYFTFNGVSSLNFGVQISGSGTYNSPQRAVERSSVPGRNGELIRDLGRYENIELKYPAFIFGDFPSRSDDFRNFMAQDSAYHRLEDSYHPDEFREASFAGPFESEPFKNRSGSFDVIFNCKPQRFLKSGENKILISGSVVLMNPSFQTALPLIVVETGTGAINVNGEIVTLTENENGTAIDCDIQEAYSLSGNLNVNGNLELTSGGYPTLKSGRNSISFAAGMSGYIIPRWWRL